MRMLAARTYKYLSPGLARKQHQPCTLAHVSLPENPTKRCHDGGGPLPVQPVQEVPKHAAGGNRRPRLPLPTSHRQPRPRPLQPHQRPSASPHVFQPSGRPTTTESAETAGARATTAFHGAGNPHPAPAGSRSRCAAHVPGCRGAFGGSGSGSGASPGLFSSKKHQRW